MTRINPICSYETPPQTRLDPQMAQTVEDPESNTCNVLSIRDLTRRPAGKSVKRDLSRWLPGN